MKKCINKVNLAGYLYDHSLKVNTVKNQASENYGKEFISGSINIAVDEEGLNIVPISFTYVTPTTKTGGTNKNYGILKNIIENNETWIKVGKEKALKLECTPSFALNDFYAQDDTLVSQVVQEGGFISVVDNFKERDKFELDLLVNGVTRIEADDNNPSDYCRVRGAGFNFRNDILPMTFVIKNPQGMEYFESLDASNKNPVFLKVWGKINCISERVEKTEESAFGEASVNVYEKKINERIITGASPTPYDFGDENVCTAEEIEKAMQNREILLADTKKRRDEYKAEKDKQTNTFGTAAPASTPTPVASTRTFNF